ncbi:MAG TPA: hypothetical protein VG738_08430 [Chitinophagaceae bacterium]|nr:hypothetical protein [Chitinophagaceae bacterium]
MKILLLFLVVSIVSRCMAQVPVSKEPHHHVVFEDSKLRALNVLIAPGDTSLFHIHSTPSVFVTFSKTKSGSQVLNGQPQKGSSTPGIIYFENLSPPHTRIHRVWNNDRDTFHVMDIELLSKDTGFAEEPLAVPYAQEVVDTPWVRAYRIKLPAAAIFSVKQRAASFFLVAINNVTCHVMENGTEKPAIMKAGEFFTIMPGEHFAIVNDDKISGAFALFETR